MKRSLFAIALFLFVWPTVTLLSLVLGELDLPIAVRTFTTSAILVPVMVYAVVPTLTRALARR